MEDEEEHTGATGKRDKHTRNLTDSGWAAPSKKRKVSADSPPVVTTKRVQVVPNAIDLEEELDITSGLLKGIQDKVVEAEQ